MFKGLNLLGKRLNTITGYPIAKVFNGIFSKKGLTAFTLILLVAYVQNPDQVLQFDPSNHYALKIIYHQCRLKHN
jgi:hypothetical protein